MEEKAGIGDIEQYVERFASGESDINGVAARFSQLDMRNLLRESIERLARIVENMSPAQLAYRPGGVPGGWDSSGDEAHFDASEICTHVVSGISFHWWGVARSLGQPRPSFPKPPDEVVPTGKKGGIMGAGGWRGESGPVLAAQLRDAAEKFLDYLGANPDVESAAGTSSMGPFKKLTAHSWVLLDVVHVGMHIKQLEAMRQQADFPPG